MLPKICVALLLCVALRAWSQVEPSAEGGETELTDDHMMVPAPVSGVGYPVAGTSEIRSNYLSAGVDFMAAYVDNVFAGGSIQPVSAETFTILPSVALSQTMPRQRRSISYGAGFTFYHPTSELNDAEQNANLSYDYRVSPRIMFSVHDGFVQATSALAQPYTNASASAGGVMQDVLTPFASRVTNTTSVGVTYQYALNAMIGAGGTSDYLNYPDASQAQGLSNSFSDGVSGFYSRRVTPRQYLGFIYNYEHYRTTQIDSTTDANTFSVYFTHYFEQHFSISVEGGAESYQTSGDSLTYLSAWTPHVVASIGWQGRYSSLSAQFTRSVTAGGGLVGSYTTTTGGVDFHRQLTRYWRTDLGSTYYNDDTQPQLGPVASSGGRSFSASASVQRRLSERLSVRFGYDRLQSHYADVPVLAGGTNSNRVYASLSYYFARPLGQ